MTVVAGLASIASLWAALQGTATVSETTRAGTRNTGVRNPDGTTSRAAAYDVDLTPTAVLGLSSGGMGRFGLTLGYSPQISRRSLFTDEQSTLVLHNAFLSLALTGPEWRVNLTQGVSVGTQSFSRLRTTPVNPMAPVSPTAPRLDLVPATDTLETAAYNTALSLGYDWTRRWTSTLTGSYGISGGRTPQSRMLMPRLDAATATLTTDYLFLAGERLGGLVTASRIAVSGGPMPMGMRSVDGTVHWSFAAMGTWTHTFGPTTSGQLMVGTVAMRSVVAYGDRYIPLLTASVSGNYEVIKRRGLTSLFTMGAALTPGVNSLNGIMQQRLQGTASLANTIERDFVLTFSGDIGQSLPWDHALAYRIIGAGVSFTWIIDDWIDLGADYRAGWQSSNAPGVTSIPYMWTAGIFLTLKAPALRF